MIPLALICAALIGLVAYQSQTHAKERAALLNRIQAPEVEVAKAITVDPSKEYAGINSDEEYWAAQEAIEP